MDEKRNSCRILVGKPGGRRDYLEDQDVDEWIILKRTERQDGVEWTRFIWLRTEAGGGVM
jgi:hypothetical protein